MNSGEVHPLVARGGPQTADSGSSNERRALPEGHHLQPEDDHHGELPARVPVRRRARADGRELHSAPRRGGTVVTEACRAQRLGAGVLLFGHWRRLIGLQTPSAPSNTPQNAKTPYALKAVRRQEERPPVSASPRRRIAPPAGSCWRTC